jgi:sugar phosphate isomerase/epimerase
MVNCRFEIQSAISHLQSAIAHYIVFVTFPFLPRKKAQNSLYIFHLITQRFMSSRRNFIRKTAMGLAGSAVLPLVGRSSAAAPEAAAVHPVTTGIAGYTFAKFDIDQSIAMMKRVGVTNLSVKDIHLPLNSSDEKIRSVTGKLRDAGINIYTVGVIYMRTKEAVDQAFQYARKVGVNMIVGVPNYDLLDYAEAQVKAHDIRLAIHNHGPEDKLYPGPGDVYNHIKNRDARVGLCIDIGHAMRAGSPPEKAIRDFRDRLFDLHIKDVSLAAKEGKAIEIGRGVINFPAVIKSLRKIKFNGVCSIEFEKDMTDPLPGIAESIGFFKGVAKGGE